MASEARTASTRSDSVPGAPRRSRKLCHPTTAMAMAAKQANWAAHIATARRGLAWRAARASATAKTSPTASADPARDAPAITDPSRTAAAVP